LNVRVAASQIHGLGAFAGRAFDAGDERLLLDDSRVVTPEAPLAAGEDARHCDYLRRGKVILMRWPERHINHSCAPNTYVRTIGGVRRVPALRGIAEKRRDHV
jgi:hypothetical protein